MKRVTLVLISSLCLSVSVLAQNFDAPIRTELISPMDENGRVFSIPNDDKSCFNFVSATFDCTKTDMYYGYLRSGDDWDWLKTGGEGSSNKILLIGELEWTDDFEIPVVEPYAKLKPGEHRTIGINASGKAGVRGADGKRGEPGKPGLNADRTEAVNPKQNEEVVLPVKTVPEDKEEKSEPEEYAPFLKAVMGNMYVMRVVDEKNDFYVLFRVEELEKGKRCVISWKRFEVPTNKD